MSELGKLMRAFSQALDEVMRHPLKGLRDWWDEGTGKDDYPPRRYTGSHS